MMYLVPEEVVKEEIVEVWILIKCLLYIAQECTETNSICYDDVVECSHRFKCFLLFLNIVVIPTAWSYLLTHVTYN